MAEDNLSTHADDYAFGSPRYAWFVTMLLSALGVASYMDRQILSLLVEPLRKDFGATDVQISFLQGIAFTLFYVLAAVPIGRAADRWRRKWIIVAGVTLWSAATLLCMAAKSYPMLFVARMLVGLGEAALIPTAISMLGDFFPRKKLAGAVSVLSASSFLGSGATLALGGLVVVHLPKSMVNLPLAGAVHGWQLAFGIAAIPGILLIALMLRVREPPRRVEGATSAASVSLREIGAFLGKNPVFWTTLMIGMAMISTYQYGVTSWAVSFFIRTYHWDAAKIGVIFGLYFVILGPLASLAGGFLCNRLVARRGANATLAIPLLSVLVALPTVVVFALSGVANLSAGLLGVMTFFSVLPLGPGLAAVPLLAPNRMRAQLTAVYMLVITLVGAGGGPWLVAAATDYVFRDPAALKYSIALVGAVLLSVAAVALTIGYRRGAAPERTVT